MAKQPQETGPRRSLLDKPRVLYSEPGVLSQSLFFGPLLLLGSLGALGCLFGTFQVPVSPLPAAITGIVCLLFSLFLFLSKRVSWIFSLGGILLWTAVVWYRFDNLLQGCAYTVNLVLSSYEEKVGITLPYLETDLTLTQAQIQENCTWFCCLFLFPFLFFLGWLLVGRKSALGAFCLTGLLLLVPLAISVIPPTPYLASLLLFWAMLLLFSHSFGGRHRLLEDRGKFHAGGNGVARPAMLLLFLGGAALSMALTYWLVPHTTYQRPQIAVDLWESLSSIRIDSPFQGGVGSGNSRVNLSSLGSRTYTGETMLRVRYQWDDSSPQTGGAANQQKDFLKSFVGSVYTGTSWERLSSQDQRELTQLLRGEHPQVMLDRIQNVYDQDSLPSYQLSVENVNANPKCVYVPYGLTQSSVGENPLAYVGDGFLESSRFFGGTTSYELEAWGLPQQQRYYPDRVITAVLTGYLDSQNKDPGDPESWEGTVWDGDSSNLLELLEQGLYDENGVMTSLRDWELWTVPQEAISCLNVEQQDFSQTLEAYNQFVYQHYTQLPDSLKDHLLEFLGENGIYQLSQYDAYSAVSQIQKVIGTLGARCTYTLTPPPLPEGKDFVEYFLFESNQGYCVHFASAAVAMFRALGLPARYAEGYAVPSGEEGWVDVPDYNAHAWVEIYTGGTGWIPVEVTPAGPDAPAATADARPVSEQPESTPTPTPTPTPKPSPSPSPSPVSEATPTVHPTATPLQTSSPTPGTVSGSAGGILWGMIGLFAGILLLVAGVLARRKILLHSRMERFSQRDRNKAALALYASLLELRKAAEKAIPTWQEDLPSGLEDLALKARFSQHALTREELLSFQEERDRMVDLLKKELPFFRRVWYQLGPVLF